MVTMSTIGRYIWKLRQERGGKGYWGLRAVSERIKISHPYLSQLENGKAKRPSPLAWTPQPTIKNFFTERTDRPATHFNNPSQYSAPLFCILHQIVLKFVLV